MGAAEFELMKCLFLMNRVFNDWVWLIRYVQLQFERYRPVSYNVKFKTNTIQNLACTEYVQTDDVLNKPN